MRYSYEFKKDPFGMIRIELPEKISILSDFIEDISTKEEVDEYIEYVKKVLEGAYKEFEITLNSTSVNIKKDVTIAEHHYRVDEPFVNIIETDEFLELMLIWREKIQETFKG